MEEGVGGGGHWGGLCDVFSQRHFKKWGRRRRRRRRGWSVLKGTRFENSPGSYRPSTAANVRLRGDQHGRDDGATWQTSAGRRPCKHLARQGSTGSPGVQVARRMVSGEEERWGLIVSAQEEGKVLVRLPLQQPQVDG